MKLKARTEPDRCSYCHDQTTDLTTCDGCGTSTHTACLQEAGSCPTLGCGTPVEPMEKCGDCKGLGREKTHDSCRSRVHKEFCRPDWCACNRCGGTGYQKKKPAAKGPTIMLTPMGHALADALIKEDKKLPWYMQRYEPEELEGDCHWCSLPADLHAGTEDKCPINAASLLVSVKYERDQERMRQATEDYRALLARQKVHAKIFFCVLALLIATTIAVIFT